MKTILDEIVQEKEKEVKTLLEKEKQNSARPLQDILESSHPKKNNKFHDALLVAGLSVIAEIKRKSPSKGPLAKIEDPKKLAHLYSKAGAAAISVLTDSKYFGGSIQDLKEVVCGFDSLHAPPILRKDFIIHPYQIAETKQMGASAVLLIVAILKDRLKEFLDIAHRIGLDCLVEVHNEDELKIALKAKAPIIGVNNRNLKTFEVDLNISKELVKKIPKETVKIAESGILEIKDAHFMHECGFNGVLIGEMLVSSKDPGKLISRIGNS